MVIAVLSSTLSSHRTELFIALGVAFLLLAVFDYLRRRASRPGEAAPNARAADSAPTPPAAEVKREQAERRVTAPLRILTGAPSRRRALTAERQRNKRLAAAAERRDSEKAARRAIRRNASRKPE